MFAKAIAVVVAALFIVVLVWLPMHRRPAKDPRPTVTSDPGRASGASEIQSGISRAKQIGPIKIEGASFRESDRNGKPMFEVTGERIENDPAAGILRIIAPKGTMYENGKPATRFEAKQVQLSYDESAKRVTFSGNVRIRSELNAAKLVAGRVEYEPNTRRVTASEGIQIDQPKLHVEGKGLITDVGLRRMEFNGPMRGWVGTRHRL